MKALGKDIKLFYDSIPDGWYHDDNELEFLDDNERWLLDDQTYYDLGKCGNLYPENSESGVTFQSQFRRWLKTRNAKTFVVVVPDGKVDSFLSAMQSLGIKVRE